MELPCKVIDMAAEEGCLMGLIVEGSDGDALTMSYIFCKSLKKKKSLCSIDDAIPFVR